MNKYFLWVLIVLVLAGAGVWYWMSNNSTQQAATNLTPSQNTPSQTQPSAPSNSSANSATMKTYSNAQYGFSLQYPSSLLPSVATMQKVEANPDATPFVLAVSTSGGPSTLTVNIDTRLKGCTQLSNQSPGTTFQGRISVNGVPFDMYVWTGAQSARVYQTIHNSLCYTVRIQPAADQKIGRAVDAIVQSFRFTK